jgi:hypothetical protein
LAPAIIRALASLMVSWSSVDLALPAVDANFDDRTRFCVVVDDEALGSLPTTCRLGIVFMLGESTSGGYGNLKFQIR